MPENLAWIGTIKEINAIPNADRIESAVVNCGNGGVWRGTIIKHQFKVGDRCEVYLQDALLQKDDPRVAFLESCNWRIKMQRLRGVPSEVLIMLPSVAGDVGSDVTELLGVTRYIKKVPPNLEGQMLAAFPGWIPKTDETNFQFQPELVKALLGKRAYSTVKADGSSATIYKHDCHLGENHFGCCSRNTEWIEDDKNGVWKIAHEYGLKDSLTNGFAIQFEVVGPGINKNRLELEKVEPRIFNVWNITEKRYLDFEDAFALAQYLGVPFVEVEDLNVEFSIDDPDMLQSHAAGNYTETKNPREGIVWRPMVEERLPISGDRLSFKVINLDYKD